MKHLVFYDHECPRCQRAVAWISQHDRNKKFQFASLQSELAEIKLSGKLAPLRHANTVVFIESPSGRIWLRGRAIFRILWLIGGKWRLLGWLYSVPFVDLAYRFIARHR